MIENIQNMSFKDYYYSLKTNLKNQICEEFGISDKTFYNKLNKVDGNDFDNLQKKRIAEITGIDAEILFPELQNQKVA